MRVRIASELLQSAVGPNVRRCGHEARLSVVWRGGRRLRRRRLWRRRLWRRRFRRRRLWRRRLRWRRWSAVGRSVLHSASEPRLRLPRRSPSVFARPIPIAAPSSGIPICAGEVESLGCGFCGGTGGAAVSAAVASVASVRQAASVAEALVASEHLAAREERVAPLAAVRLARRSVARPRTQPRCMLSTQQSKCVRSEHRRDSRNRPSSRRAACKRINRAFRIHRARLTPCRVHSPGLLQAIRYLRQRLQHHLTRMRRDLALWRSPRSDQVWRRNRRRRRRRWERRVRWRDRWGGGFVGSCCQQHPWPGCANPNVYNCVCPKDPFCCQNQWDSLCASEVSQLGCGNCGGAGGGGGGGTCNPAFCPSPGPLQPCCVSPTGPCGVFTPQGCMPFPGGPPGPPPPGP